MNKEQEDVIDALDIIIAKETGSNKMFAIALQYIVKRLP